MSDFAYLESTDRSRRVHQRVFSRPNAVHLNELVLEAGEEILDELEDYIGVDYSLPKMDQAGIPDFSAGAMENWGLVTYRYRIALITYAHTIQLFEVLILL